MADPKPKTTGVHAAVMKRVGQRSNATARAVTLIFSLFIAGSVVWSTQAKVPGLVRATGELTAAGPVRRVEHFDGGVVQQILVKEGDKVAAGDVMARMRPESIDLQMDQYAARIQIARRRILRLQALLQAFPKDPTPESQLAPADEDLALQQAQIALGMARRRSAGLAIQEQAAALRGLRAVRETAQEHLALAERRNSRMEQLFGRGLITQAEFDEEQAELSRLRRDALTAEADLAAGRNKLTEAQAAYDEMILEERESRLEALETALAERDEAALQLEDMQLRKARLDIRAPVSGVVQSLAVAAEGAVVGPGGLVAEVLPTEVPLVAEVRMSPNDVGQVVEGDSVSLTVTAFDRKRYGQVVGTIETISATSVTLPNEEPFFKVVVTLDRQSIGKDAMSEPLRAGMTVQAEIVTSARTVAQYLLKPLETSLAVTMSER